MRRIFLTAWMMAATLTMGAANETVISIDTARQVGRVDERLYGFLLEHLYHSVSNGLWGECVWNRSFEELLAQGRWTSTTEGELTLHATGEKRLQLFRIGKAGNSVLRLDMKRLKGDGDVIIGMRDQHREQMLTNRIFLHLGEQQNSMEIATGWIWHTPVARVTTQLLPSVSGRSNGWNHLELSFRDSRLVVMMNGQCLFDQEIDHCPKDGAITLGAENCDVSFRYISAIDTLPDGSPAPVPDGSPAAVPDGSPSGNAPVPDGSPSGIDLNLNLSRHWNLVGKGQTAIDYDAPLNQDVALHVVNTGQWAGLEQAGKYYLRSGDPLLGSVFLKGDGKAVTVQLLNNDSVVTEQTIDRLTTDWQEFPLTLESSVNCRDALLRILSQGAFSIDQVSLMHRSSIANGGYRPELAQAVKDLKPTSLRWPGGSFSEHYRFEYGIGPQHQRRGILRWDDFDPLSFGTDEFIGFCHKVGAEPVIVVPIGYHNYAGYAPDSVLTALDAAVPDASPSGKAAVPDASPAAVPDGSPSGNAAVPDASPSGKTDWLQRALNWLEYCNGDSATTWGRLRAQNGHPEPYNVKYWEIDNEVWKMSPKLYVEIARLFSIAMKRKDPSIKVIGCGCGRLGAEGAGLDSILISEAARHFDYISPHYYQTIDKYDSEGVEEYGRYLDKLAHWIAVSKNPQMKIYLSEWNLDGVDMRTGLFAGGFLNRLERTPAVEMAAPALLLRHTSAPGWNNAFINFDQDRWFAAPNYVVLKLWRDHYLPRRVAVDGDNGLLNMVATTSNDRQQVCLKVVNAAAAAATLRVRNGRSLGSAQWQVVSAGLKDANRMEQPQLIEARKMPVSYDGQDILITIPGYSASVLSWTTAAQ